jgi:peroxiredoxin
MAQTYSSMLALQSEAPAFNLPDVVSDSNVSLSHIKGKKGTLVLFICNHCPFVVHVIDKVVELAAEYQKQGIAFVAISANDVQNYPDDSPEKMKQFAEVNHFTFPYLYDETQEVAKAYKAECTPDFFLFEENLKCVYRGRLDDSTPGNGTPVSGKDVKNAMQALLANEEINNDQQPSVGCNIKWK